eukprot:TRINITY_DN12378_c0_g3_i2.p1 TRINITY_DN12378_c0_g3~~TRINITY_DN12378_c0_g3_i2.p1  ORF type:complete len:579 (+),score=32.45 TRINITY_DN12378_c0_g3_i2:114-1850(+)
MFKTTVDSDVVGRVQDFLTPNSVVPVEDCSGILTNTWIDGSFSNAQLPLTQTELRVTSWLHMFVASLASFVHVTLGLLILGVGESGGLGWQSHSILLCRSCALCVLYLMPHSVCSSNLLGFAFYGLEPGSRFFLVLCIPSLNPWRMKEYARSNRWPNVFKAVMIPIMFNVMSSVLVLLLIIVPLSKVESHFGFCISCFIGGILCRLVVAAVIARNCIHTAHLIPYTMMILRCGMVIVLGSFIGFAAYVWLRPLIGDYLDLCMVPVIALHEALCVFLVEHSFCKSYVANAELQAALNGSSQGIIPSTFIALAHSNAEAARLALLVHAAAENTPIAIISLTVTLSCGLNVMLRTRLVAQMLSKLRPIYDSNGLQVWFGARYQMGYPCYFVIIAVIAARYALGTAALDPGFCGAVYLSLGAEVIEDLLVHGISRYAPWSELPRRPPLSSEEVHDKAVHFLARQQLRREQSTFSRVACGLGCCKSRDTGIFESNEDVEQVKARLVSAHQFRYQIQELFPPLPLWSHYFSVFVSHTWLVWWLAYLFGGFPQLLGLLEPSRDILDGKSYDHGILWWTLPKESQL